MLITVAIVSGLLNALLLAGIPFFAYWLYHKVRKKRSLGEVFDRAGLRWTSGRYLGFSAVLALVIVLGLVVWPPALEPMTAKVQPKRHSSVLA